MLLFRCQGVLLRPSLLALRGRPKLYTSRAQNDESEESHKLAREWLAKLNINTIPRRLGEVTFSRSSGPGGQNVNKTNSKATLRVPLQNLHDIVPDIIYTQLSSSTHYTRRSDSILIQTDTSRKQNENVEGAWHKLVDLLEKIGSKTVRGETSSEQADRVKELQKKQEQARKKMKKAQSAKKSSRKGNGSYDY